MVSQHVARRVLVADDDPIFLDFFCGDLPASRFDIVTARDGVEAMAQLVGGRFDLLVADLLMPGIDGLRLIALVRSIPGLYGLPILVVTGCIDDETREKCFRVGANEVLTKPIKAREVPAVLDRLMWGPYPALLEPSAPAAKSRGGMGQPVRGQRNGLGKKPGAERQAVEDQCADQGRRNLGNYH